MKKRSVIKPWTDYANCHGAIFSRWVTILRKRGRLLKQILGPAGYAFHLLTTPLILHLSGRTDGCLFGEVRRTVGTGQVLAYVRFRKLSCVVEASSIVGSGMHGMGANAMVFYDKRARSDVLHNAELHL